MEVMKNNGIFYSVKRRYWTKLLLGMVQCIYSYRSIFSIFSGVIYFFHAFVLKGSVYCWSLNGRYADYYI